MGPQEFQTSFIPKKPISEPVVTKKAPVGIFTFLSTIIFLASLVAAGGTYFYNSYLTKRVSGMNAQLVRAQNAFEPTLIADLETLDRRMTASNQVLAGHVTVSPLFKSLQDLTLKSVRYTKFTYTFDEEANAYIVNITGEARSYRDIALQSDMFTKNKYIKDPIFSNLKLNERGGVFFDLMFTVDPNFLLYQEVINRNATAPKTVTQ